MTAIVTTFGTMLALTFVTVLLGAWLYLFFTNPDFSVLGAKIDKNVTIFLLLAITSVLGTSLRLIASKTQRKEGENVIKSLLTNLLKGLLIAFAFGLLYLFGSYVSTGAITDLSDESHFVRVGLAMSIIGFGVAFVVDVAESELAKRMGLIVKTGT